MLTVGALMRRAREFHRDRPAVVAGGRSLTFAEAWGRGVRMANGLLGLGMAPGERVAILTDNTLEAQDLLAGAAAANLVRVPLYARASRQTHTHMIGHTRCRVLLVAEKYLPDVKGLDDELPHLDHIVVCDEGYEPWLTSQSDREPAVGGRPDDLHIIRHTGGTTGLAKGVPYTHRQWITSGRDWTYPLPPIAAGDRCMHVSPVSHGSGYLYLPVWLHGACNVLMSTAEPGAVLDEMQARDVNYMFAVPTLVASLARHPSATGRRFPGLKTILVGGAPISESTALAAHRVFGPVLYQIYGQAEVQPATTMSPQEWFGQVEGSHPLRSAGRTAPFAGLEIRDADNQPVPVGGEGEIAIRCDGQMDGYWDDPAGTEQRIRDGWVLTGDIGQLDENGYLYILDRKDDVIISGGVNIWPAELENVIAAHPEVLEVAVFGVPSERWGETPAAVCTVEPDSAVTERDIIDLCVRELGSYRKPTVVTLQTDPLPKSPVGKLQRRVLSEGYWRDEQRRVSGS